MSTSNTGPFGPFRYDVRDETWWWSDPVYEIHGFAPGEVMPTTAVILSHKHPDDIPAVTDAFEHALRSGATYSLWHRIIDARSNVRQVLTVGGGERDESGAVVEIRGYMVDVTDAQRRSAAQEMDAAVRASADTRALIEQVKGVLMVTYALDADEAFELLRRYSQTVNVKVREVARLLTSMVTEAGSLPDVARETLGRLLADDTAQSLQRRDEMSGA